MKTTTIRRLAAAVFLACVAGAPASGQTIAISNATVAEGNSGVTNMTFNVTLSAAAAGVTRVRYATSDGTALSTFTTTLSPAGPGVTIPAGAPGNTAAGVGAPYPSTLNLAGLLGRVRSVEVTLTGLTHTFADDLDVLLVGPGGQKVMLMSDAGGDNEPNGNFTFSDLAAAKIPDLTVGAGTDPLPAGTFRPSDYGAAESLPGPAPAGPYASVLSVFNGTDPNGTWSLYIRDDANADVGALTSWSLNIQTGTGDYAGQEGALEFAVGETLKTVVIPVFGDTESEGSETFAVLLTNAEGGPTFSDSTGVGTITDDEPAHPSRVFVSTAGNDANDCSLITTPCLSLAGALLQVTTDGEVIFLTGGEYDAAPITITKGVKVNAPTGVVAFIRQPITVNAPSARVVLRGLTLKGAGSGTGVLVLAADGFYLENSTLDRWGTGLRVNTAVASRTFVTGSVLRFNTNGLSDVGALAGSLISIEASRFEANTRGIDGYEATFSVRESSFFGNTGSGAEIGPGPSSFQGCEFTGNLLGVRGWGAIVRLDRNLIHGNTTGVLVNGAVETLGTNVIRGNTTNVSGALTAVTGG